MVNGTDPASGGEIAVSFPFYPILFPVAYPAGGGIIYATGSNFHHNSAGVAFWPYMQYCNWYQHQSAQINPGGEKGNGSGRTGKPNCH